VQTQLHSVPPFAASLALCLIIAYFSDKVAIRAPFVLFGYALLIAGLAIMLTVHGKSHFSVEYLGIHLIAMGALGSGACIICWVLMNQHGHVQRSIGSGFLIGFGNLGGIVATFTFLKKDAPNYTSGYWILMGMSILGTVATIAYGILIQREKRRARRNGDEKELLLSM
jgi:hypothetical protein